MILIFQYFIFDICDKIIGNLLQTGVMWSTYCNIDSIPIINMYLIILKYILLNWPAEISKLNLIGHRAGVTTFDA